MSRLKFEAPPERGNTPQLDLALATAYELAERAGDRLPELKCTLHFRSAGPDGAFEAGFADGKVTLAGDEEGLRCGIYTLLNELGIHWFNPAEPVVFPERAAPFDPAKFAGFHRPDFAYRGLHICAGKYHWDDTVGRWMSFNRMNRKLTSPRELGTVGKRLRELGLRPDTTVHAYARLIPDSKYFQTNPEFFALVGGKRLRQGGGGQLCLSNPELRRVFAANLLAEIRANDFPAVHGFCPNDGYGHCECPECRSLDTPEDREKGLVNRRVADFVRDICARIGTAAPEAQLGHYSYSNFADFTDHLPEVPENLLVSCTMFHCYRHGIDDRNCPVNVLHRERLEKLRAKVKHVYIYDYYAHAWTGMPAPYQAAQEADFRYFRSLGLDGWLSECSGADDTGWNAQWMNFHRAARRMWNASLSETELMAETVRARCGAGAGAMGKYFSALAGSAPEKCLTKKPEDFAAIFTPETRRRCGEWLGLAETAAPGNPSIAAERRNFDFWCKSADERARYRTEKVLPLRKYSVPWTPDRIFAVEHATGLPDMENDTKTGVFDDGDAIRVRIRALETHMDSLTRAPDIFGGDCVELFFDDGKMPDKCYHFLLAPDGRMSASECEGPRWNWSWSHGATLKAECRTDGWELDFRLPKTAINAGKSFGFTLSRNRHAGGAGKIYGAPDGGAYFRPREYLRFETG